MVYLDFVTEFYFVIHTVADGTSFADLTHKVTKMNIHVADLVNSAEPDDVAHNEPPHLGPHCLPSSL